MTTIKQWLRITPLDTMFFKGSEPMTAGVDHEVRTVFPPLPVTLVGAIRTAVLGQRNIDPYQYTGDGTDDIVRRYPLLGTPDAPGFRLAGPLFAVTVAKGNEVFFPAPAHWHGDPKGAETRGSMSVTTAVPATSLLTAVRLSGSTTNPLWLLDPRDHRRKSLAGWWANAAAFTTMAEAGSADLLSLLVRKDFIKDFIPGKPAILPMSAFAVTEARTGIALEHPLRRVRQGHLYSSTHVRLWPEVTLLAGLSEALCPDTLDSDGIMQLGGERRMARYTALDGTHIALPQQTCNSGQWAVAVSAVPWAEFEAAGLVGTTRASGPLVRMGGWNMKNGFHKKMTAWLPPGTVVHLSGQQALPFGFISI
ncbi:MAG TPA: hypothetical protein ENN06_10430 [Desulfobacteraceae bacterium]|nr:hypothetical protein [Desulfobacteraceae bacterium]